MVSKTGPKLSAKAHADFTRRINAALDRYEAFATGVKRGDVSAQGSGVKILESLANLAAQEILLLRNSADLRRFLAAAISRISVAALLSSAGSSIQLSALKSANSLARVPDALTTAVLPCVVKLLGHTGDASPLAADALQCLAARFTPSVVWQAIQEGGGSKMLLAVVEAASKGQIYATAHLHLLQFLLQSSALAQSQLLADPATATRWSGGLLCLLQQQSSSRDLLAGAAIVQALACYTDAFVSHVEGDGSKYTSLLVTTTSLLEAGNRLAWKDADVSDIVKTSCSLLDTVACVVPPHVSLHRPSPSHTTDATGQAVSEVKQTPQRAKAYESAIKRLAFATKQIIQQAEANAGSAKPGLVGLDQVLPELVRALCVLLLPPVHLHGSDAAVSPWVQELGPDLPAQLLRLAFRDSPAAGVAPWCWQALHLLQARLTDSQRATIVKHGFLHKVPPLAQQSAEPLHSHCITLQLALTCSTPVGSDDHAHNSAQHRHPLEGLSHWAQQRLVRSGQEPETALQHFLWYFKPLLTARPCQLVPEQVTMASFAAGLQSLAGQGNAWEIAWLGLQLASGKMQTDDAQDWDGPVIASLQALTEASKASHLPPHISQQMLQLLQDTCGHPDPSDQSPHGKMAFTSVKKPTMVPSPLRQHANMQLQLWWAVATAACCSQVGLSSKLGQACKALLQDAPAADVAFQLQSPSEVIWGHASIIAARCPKLYDAILHERGQQQQQPLQASSMNAQSPACGSSSSAAGNSAVGAVKLGKQVSGQPFRQVLQYIYTGQVLAIQPEDRPPLQRLAQALGLRQLVALVSGAKPAPGAAYIPFSLSVLMPQQAVTIPVLPAGIPGNASQQAGHQSQKLQQQQQPHPQLTQHDGLSQHGGLSQHALQADALTAADIQSGSPALHDIHTRQHPALQHLTSPSGLSLGTQFPARLAVPSSVPAHADLLLVPAQIQPLAPGGNVSTADGIGISSGCTARSQGTHDGREASCRSALLRRGGDECTRVQAPGIMLGLPAHSAVLIASSSYFGAMLSDRWQANTQAGSQQHRDRSLPIAHLPTHDLHVVLCLLHFCYTQELCLGSSVDCMPQAIGPGANVLGLNCPAAGVEVCACCWNARTAVRLAAAAEALIMIELHQLCLQFVEDVRQQLPDICRQVILSDLAQLHQLDAF